LGKQLLGWLDEVQIAHTARSPDWLKWAFRNQSPDYAVLSFAQDETNDSGGDGHFAVIMQNVTPDGWLIIGLTLFMLLVALVVIVSKVLQIQRIRQGNAIFLDHYQRLDKQYPEQLLQQAELITAAHPHTWQYSPLYQLYQLSLSEVQKLQLEFGASLSEPAWHYVRVKMNTRITQENQSLQRHMVLLTIAIAGGPFLGLLGTVTGVMITFAVIAATGDVNINTIAPGIAAALLATVAGLAVAIPSLFAYNYLLTQIKDLSVAMRVFSDEFLAMQAMRAARCANI
jgi:biopolymer transport protein ExbB